MHGPPDHSYQHNVIHRIETSRYGAVTAAYRLHGRADIHDLKWAAEGSSRAVVTFVAPHNVDLDVLRPDILPPKAS